MRIISNAQGHDISFANETSGAATTTLNVLQLPVNFNKADIACFYPMIDRACLRKIEKWRILEDIKHKKKLSSAANIINNTSLAVVEQIAISIVLHQQVPDIRLESRVVQVQWPGRINYVEAGSLTAFQYLTAFSSVSIGKSRTPMTITIIRVMIISCRKNSH